MKELACQGGFVGRSGKLNCSNDIYISELLVDPNFEIRHDGTIWTRITKTGKVSVANVWRQAGHGRKGYYTLHYKGRKIQIHRIIYAKFKGNLEPDLVVNHIDANGYNNDPANLELVTQSTNNYHRFNREGKPPVMGNARLDWEKVRTIRDLHKLVGVPYSRIAIGFNISKGHVSQIVNNEIWVEGKQYA